MPDIIDTSTTGPLPARHAATYSVYWSGHMLGSGRFEGPGLSLREAKAAQRKARKLQGCDTIIERDA
jgi:hypothetical protein